MIELVYSNGERVDLRYVSDLTIKLIDVPPEIMAEFEEIARFSEKWQAYISNALGVPAHIVNGSHSNEQEAKL